MRAWSLRFLYFNLRNSTSPVPSSSMIRHASFVPVRYRDAEPKSIFLMKTTGMTRRKALSAILTNNEFRLTSLDSMKLSFDILKNAGYVSSLDQYPELLCMHSSVLKNRILLLEDCSFNKEKIPYLLSVFESLPNKKLFTLKNFDILPPTVNLIENFFHLCSVPIAENSIEFDDWDTFKDVYCKFYKFYVQRELGLSDERVEKILKPVKWISFRYLKYNLKIVRDIFHSNNDDIQFLRYLLHSYPDSLLHLFKILKNGHLKALIKKNPKIVDVSTEVIAKNAQFLQENNIPNTAPTYASLLTMDSDLRFNRLSKILETYELQSYVKHPRFMKLIDECCLARERLDVLKKLNMRCYTLNQLTCQDESFVRHISNGIDKVRCNDKITFLTGELPYTRSEIKQRLHLNPYAGYIPLHTVCETVNYLKEMGFPADDIFISLPIVLYHKKVVAHALTDSVPKLLKSMDYPTDADIIKLKACLPLVLYCIEKQHNFKGDGVWIQDERADLYIG